MNGLAVKWFVSAAAAVGLAVASAGCSAEVEKVRRDEPLRVLGAEQGVRIGTAIDDEALVHDADYVALVEREVDMVVAENVMKWSTIQPQQGEFDFEAADRLVEFAEANEMAVRGHVLVWSRQLPDWVREANWSRDEAIDVLREHITMLVGRYRGRIEQWDVVNEPIAQDGDGLEVNPWLELIGPDHIELAFEFAREADPDAELFINDFDGAFPGDRTDRLLALAGDLVDVSAPIDGVGLQFHHRAADSFTADDVVSVFDRIDALGLQAAVTEADVRIELVDGEPSAGDLAAQAELVGAILEGCIAADNCDTFVMWGLTDRWSWVPDTFPGEGVATLFDTNGAPKPAHESLQLALS